MQASTGTSADFTGVFIKWDYQPGQKYIQLLFKTATGRRLSLSQSKHLARSLIIGGTYRIKGREYSIGGKSYVHEPTAIPLETRVSHTKRNTVVFVCIILALAAAAGGLYMSISHSRSRANLSNAKQAAIDSQPPASATLTSAKATVSPTVSNPPAAQPPVIAPSTSTKTVVKKTAPTPVVSSETQTPIPAAFQPEVVTPVQTNETPAQDASTTTGDTTSATTVIPNSPDESVLPGDTPSDPVL